MRLLRFCSLLILPLAAVCCGSGDSESESTDTQTVTTSPTSLTCTCEGGSVTFEVTASDAWQPYVSDDSSSWITLVGPEYSSSNTGTCEVTVDENLSTSSRTGTIIIKCGKTRHSVSLVQEAYVIDDEGITAPDGYTLVWHDEFDLTYVDTKKWEFENWAPGYVNNELQRYVAGGELDGNKTAFIEDGALNIRAMKYNDQVISARMNTQSAWKYGYMEARIWLPTGKGTWPAFWMMPTDQTDGWPNCGEIDIMEEVGVDPNYVSSSIHCESYNHTINTQKTKSKYVSGAESEYHVYAAKWTEKGIWFYIDGTNFFSFENDGAGSTSTWPFNKSFYITLNLAWGGDWGGYNGVDESALPCTMKIDYVRVFQESE